MDKLSIGVSAAEKTQILALGNKEIPGIIRFITAAPGFANLKMSREKGMAVSVYS